MALESSSDIETLSENEIQPVLDLLQGVDADDVARKSGLDKDYLCRLRDDMLARVARERAGSVPAAAKKVGRNDPCPCGSGKKYKHCCMGKTAEATRAAPQAPSPPSSRRQREQERLAQDIEKTFGLIRSGIYGQAIDTASKLLRRYPNEDRLHDIAATGHLYAGNFEAATSICRKRLAVAESEKAYFIAHRRYRDADIDDPALSYYYPPLAWLQKLWIALKASDYQNGYPQQRPDPRIVALTDDLQTADDDARFAQTQSQGLDLRRGALQPAIEGLKAAGPEAVAYLRPLAIRYGWTGCLVPEILAAFDTEEATRALLDISMFGFSYASGASLHYLEKRGQDAVEQIQHAFSQNREFDAIKTGMVSVLGNIGGRHAYALLMGLLGHDSAHIVNWAGDAVGKFNNPEALPALVKASERIGGQPMIDAAIEHLRDLE